MPLVIRFICALLTVAQPCQALRRLFAGLKACATRAVSRHSVYSCFCPFLLRERPMSRRI